MAVLLHCHTLGKTRSILVKDHILSIFDELCSWIQLGTRRDYTSLLDSRDNSCKMRLAYSHHFGNSEVQGIP